MTKEELLDELEFIASIIKNIPSVEGLELQVDLKWKIAEIESAAQEGG